MNKLEAVFYDPTQGLINSTKLYKKLKESGHDFTHKEVDDYVKKQAVTQMTHRTVKPKRFSTVQANYPRNIYQMDIIVYDRYKINNYAYILVVIDIYSRFLSTRAMTSRKGQVIFDHFKSIITDMGMPDKIECDNEFNTSLFNKYFDDNEITPIFSDPSQLYKNAIVERVNGTISNQLQKVRITTNNYKWYEYLPKITDNYNNTYHSTTKATPLSIFKNKGINKQKYVTVSNMFRVNDKVRKRMNTTSFTKGDQIKFSKSIYIVEKVTPTRIKLTEFDKLYKPEELKLVPDVENNDVEEPKTMTKQNKRIQMMKREDINPDNILPMRTRTKNLIKLI
jgi:hypothetical protein